MSPGFLRTTLLCLTLIFASCGDDSAVNNVDTVPPAAIGDLLAQCRSDGVVTLIWTASGDDGMSGTASRYKIGYSVERIGSGNFDQVPLLSGPPSPKAAGRIDAVDISGLYPDAVYYFAIKVIDEAGNQSGLSNTVHLRASPNADTTPPATITDLQVTAVTEQSVALAWTATGDNGSVGFALQYQLRMDEGEDFDWGRATIVTNVPQPDSAGKREAMIVTGLAADSSYSFAIRAADEEDNWSPVSNVIAATTWVSTDSVPPSAIVDLIVIDSATNHISLSWTAPGDDSDSGTARAYEVRFSVGSSLDWEAARSVDEVAPPQSAGTPETLIVPDLEEETAYAFGIKSVDENNNWSGLSNVVSLTTPVDTIPPNAITDLQVTDSTHTSVTLTWTASGDDGASGTAHVYSLRYSQSPIDDATWAAATEVAGLSAPQGSGSVETFTVTDLGNDVIYYFAIRTADDKLNWSPLAENLEVYLPGPLVWQKSYGGADTDEANAVTLANDGGIVIAGKTNSSGAGDFDGYVVKIDSDGDVVWEKTFGGAAEDQFNDIIATPDGGFAAVGFTKSAGAGGNDGWLVKLNSSGTKVWERTHGADSHESFLEVLPAGDGGYILAGYGMGGAYVVKTDAAGDSVWADVYFRSSNCNGHSSSGVYNSVAQMPDGSIMIAWTAWIRRFWPPEDCVPEVHCFLTKLDVQQNEVWTKLSHGDWFGGYAEWMTGTMVSTSSGGFAMAGGENTKFFASWDTGGNQLWRQNSGHWMVDPVDLAQLSDGSFIPVGYTRGSFGQAWFGLVNASGELVDQFLIGGDAADRFHAVTELDDGSIIAVGYTRSFSESTDLYVVKLSP